ncbi:MAG: S1C family serine protease [Halodesulfurarchaeum sp.]
MRPFLGLFAIAVLIGAAVGAGAGVLVVATDAGPTLDAPGTPTSGPDLSASTNFSALYDRTADAVVQVRVGTGVDGSQGSGFLYEGQHVVTNEHVVGDASTVSIQFSDGVWRSATVVGTDAYTDLAVLRVESVPSGVDPLPVATEVPREGEPVAALGSPFGLRGTITHGIVSGVNRSMEVGEGYSIPDTIQTDAPINPGNSGGPLVSTDGTVVGVNRARGGDNVGFAVSAHVVERVVPELIQRGEFDHAYLGIRSVPVTPSTATANDLDRATGIAVVEVLSGGPADGRLQAGTTEDGTVSGGDVIVAVDETPIRSHEELSRYLLLRTGSGEEVTFTVVRDGTRQTVTVRLGERPAAP